MGSPVRRHPMLERVRSITCEIAVGHQLLDGGAEPVRIRLVHPLLVDREGHGSAGWQDRECVLEGLLCGVRAAERSSRHQPAERVRAQCLTQRAVVREVPDHVVGVDAWPVAQTRHARCRQRVDPDNLSHATATQELADHIPCRRRRPGPSSSPAPTEARDRAQEAGSRDLRRSALQPFLDDMARRGRYGVYPRVSVQVDDLVLTQRDVLTVGHRRAEQTNAGKHITHVRETMRTRPARRHQQRRSVRPRGSRRSAAAPSLPAARRTLGRQVRGPGERGARTVCQRTDLTKTTAGPGQRDAGADREECVVHPRADDRRGDEGAAIWGAELAMLITPMSLPASSPRGRTRVIRARSTARYTPNAMPLTILRRQCR